MDISKDEITQLAQIERDMDKGITKFVKDVHGNRMSVSDEVMQEFGLQSGQTISHYMITEILRFKIASLERRIAIDKAASKD